MAIQYRHSPSRVFSSTASLASMTRRDAVLDSAQVSKTRVNPEGVPPVNKRRCQHCGGVPTPPVAWSNLVPDLAAPAGEARGEPMTDGNRAQVGDAVDVPIAAIAAFTSSTSGA